MKFIAVSIWLAHQLTLCFDHKQRLEKEITVFPF
jgi:hypothetical protein